MSTSSLLSFIKIHQLEVVLDKKLKCECLNIENKQTDGLSTYTVHVLILAQSNISRNL